jgi:hypothetical protein
MKKRIITMAITALAFLGFKQASFAQVKGVGYTLSPIGEKVWWDKNSGFKDGYMLGGQFGFSFGEFVELRGLYLQGLNMQRNFSAYNIAPENLEDLDVSLTRWGGDLKLNLGRGALLPYLTIGTGVQTTQLGELDKNKQIYFTGGLGVMLSVGDRYTLGLQALRTSFRDNPVNTLLTADERTLAGLSGSDFDYRSMNNWSARASLLFYLGGRRPSQMTEVDKAYMDSFSSGLKGLSLLVEPVVGKFEWSDNLPYKSTTFGGVATGFDFGPLVGIRAYYLRSFDDKLFSDFDRLEVWGGEGKFKLASSGGLIPFLTAGGGKINVLSRYENPDFPIAATDTVGIEGRGFASGGGGFDLALSRHVKLSAFARAMLTSSNKGLVENISSPDELSTSWLYGASLNFIIGKKPENPKNMIDYSSNDSYDTRVRADLEKEKRNTKALRNQYQEKLNNLEKEIDQAQKSGDSRKMAEKYEEQESLKRMISRLDDVFKKEKEANEGSDLVQMNPSELRSLVEEIKESQKRNEATIKEALEIQGLKNELQVEKMGLRLQALEESMKKSKSTGSERNDELNTLRKQLSDLKRESSPENSELEALRKELREMKEGGKEMTQEQKELETLRKEIQELKKEKSTESSRVERKVQTKEQKELEDLKKELQEFKNSLKSEADQKKSAVEDESEEVGEEMEEKAEEVMEKSEDRKKKVKEDSEKDKKKVKEKVEDELEDNDTTASYTLPDGRSYRVGGYSYISDEQLQHRSQYKDSTSKVFGRLYYEGASAIVGLSLGGDPTFNIGLRQHYRFNKSNFFLMPETFFGFGSPASFGIFANGVYQFKSKETASFEPYVGVGLGLMQIGIKGDQKLKGATNILFGANLFRMGGGRFYADWNARNFFKVNQIALGYRLPF